MSGAGRRGDEPFEAWVGRLRAGDEEAARRLVELFATRLLGLAEHRLDRRVRRRVEPEDVLQSVFRTFFRRQSEGEVVLGDWEGLWGLLAQITARKCINAAKHHRRLRRDPAREVALDFATLGPSAAGRREPAPDVFVMVSDALEHAQRGLGERDRQVVALWLLGYPPQEIAALLDCSRSTVFRVRDILRRRLREALSDGTDDAP